MVNVRGEAMVNMHELNAMHVCEEAMYVKKLCMVNVCGEATVNAHELNAIYACM